MNAVNIFWFRRDLRLHDNHGFFQALRDDNKVRPIFIFDTEIIANLNKDDHRITFIHQTLEHMNTQLAEIGKGIEVFHGSPETIFKTLLTNHHIEKVYTNHDYEPYAITRDEHIQKLCSDHGVLFHSFKDQVIFETNEVVKDDGTPYLVYTPYKKAWRALVKPERDFTSFESEHLLNQIATSLTQIPSLADIGCTQSHITVPSYRLDTELLDDYAQLRDTPYAKGTSMLSTYLRFGLVSVREIMRVVYHHPSETFANELIWREFFMAILFHFPHTVNQPFREEYAHIAWRNDEEQFERWKRGTTGYPLVDAGMRELNQTGFMHNRVRMVVASFLCKDLHIDWKWGERYFAEKLFDYELSSNVGNWQWAAGTGVDAAPYFRIFNPDTQFEKFDSEGNYVRQWVPEYFGIGYVPPIVNHQEARDITLNLYKQAVIASKQG